MHGNRTQYEYATHYAINYTKASPNTDCGKVSTDMETYYICVTQGGVKLNDVIPFTNSVFSFFERSQFLIKTEGCFNLDSEHKLPRIGFISFGTHYHAILVFYVALYDAGHHYQRRVMGIVDPGFNKIEYLDPSLDDISVAVTL